jgi:hypothetical protein
MGLSIVSMSRTPRRAPALVLVALALLLLRFSAQADECGLGSDFVACNDKAKCDIDCERSTCR